MFAKKDVQPSDLEKAITKAFAHLDQTSPETKEYADTVDQLTQLYKLKEIDSKVNSSSHVSRETLAIIAGNLAGIILILGHERANVIASKALGFVTKLR